MAVAILHISGPPDAGKTAAAIAYATARRPRPTYYLRLDTEREGIPALRLSQPLPVMADARRLVSVPGVVFETLAAAVGEIAQRDGDATIVVESDNEPCFRHAYPWHGRMFVLPPIANPRQLFRSRQEIADAIRELMQDTHSFATEVFGLEHGPGDSSIFPSAEAKAWPDGEATPEMVDEFLASDIGAEIACRMRLHSAYHAIMESDLVLLCEARGSWAGPAAETAEMLSRLLEMARGRLDRHIRLAHCNPNRPEADDVKACVAIMDDLVEKGRSEGL